MVGKPNYMYMYMYACYMYMYACYMCPTEGNYVSWLATKPPRHDKGYLCL